MYCKFYNFCENFYFLKKRLKKQENFTKKTMFFCEKIKDDIRILSALHNIGIRLLLEGKIEWTEYLKDIANYPAIFPYKATTLNNIGLWYEIWEKRFR